MTVWKSVKIWQLLPWVSSVFFWHTVWELCVTENLRGKLLVLIIVHQVPLRKLVVVGTEAGIGVAASWGAVPTRVEEERAWTGENERQDAQADYW